MERKPQKAPLPCFGLEFNRRDPICQKCPHFTDCSVYTGSRLDRVPLDKVQFSIVPGKFKLESFETEDPELPHLQRLYTNCYSSVFHRNPTDNASQYRKEIAANAVRAGCSARMFILANMVAHIEHEKSVVSNTQKQRSAPFYAKLLINKLAVRRAQMYQDMCRDRYGTFNLSSLAVLTDSESMETLESTMLRSEVTAAQWLVRYKIFHSDAVEPPLYESTELQLAPEWLATEHTYHDAVLKPYLDKTIKGTELQERHRFKVCQTLGYYKQHISSQKTAWIARQDIFPEAVRRVCRTFNHDPADFLHPRAYTIDPNDSPKKSPLDFWKTLALAIRHYHCWLYINNEPSYFTPRRNVQLNVNK